MRLSSLGSVSRPFVVLLPITRVVAPIPANPHAIGPECQCCTQHCADRSRAAYVEGLHADNRRFAEDACSQLSRGQMNPCCEQCHAFTVMKRVMVSAGSRMWKSWRRAPSSPKTSPSTVSSTTLRSGSVTLLCFVLSTLNSKGQWPEATRKHR